VGYQPILS